MESVPTLLGTKKQHLCLGRCFSSVDLYIEVSGWGWGWGEPCQDAHNFEQEPLEIVVREDSASFGLVLPFLLWGP